MSVEGVWERGARRAGGRSDRSGAGRPTGCASDGGGRAGRGFPGVEEATPFRPVDVPPDGRVLLYVVGRAGDCAFGPSFRVDDSHAYASSRKVRVAYSVLGLSSVGEVELPVTLAQPQSEDCTGT